MKPCINISRIFECSLHRSFYTQVQFVYSRIAYFLFRENLNRKPLNPACTRCSGLFCLELFNAHTLSITTILPGGLPMPFSLGALSPHTEIGTCTLRNQEFFTGGAFFSWFLKLLPTCCFRFFSFWRLFGLQFNLN